MRLIDADALIDSIVNNQSTVHGHHEQLQILAIVNKYAVDLIKKAPTVDSEKHAMWVGDDSYESWQGHYEAYKCSNCGYSIPHYMRFDLMDERTPEDRIQHYCLHCGARMDN